MHDTLVAIAKQLPLPALLKFAKANDQTYLASQEAWQTWQQACASHSFARMFSDRSWMDAYARNVRQHKFRIINAAEHWRCIHDIPQWLQAALHFSFKFVTPVTFALRVSKAFNRLHVLVFKQNKLWLVVSSYGKTWCFEECILYVPSARVYHMLNGLCLLLQNQEVHLLAPLPLPAAEDYDKYQLLDEAAARLHCTHA